MTRIGRTSSALSLIVALAIPGSAVACSSCSASVQEGEKSMDTWVETALRASEKTGKLDGLEIEYYVGGGLPPPHYVSDQFRMLVRDGRDVLEVATPNYAANPPRGASYPRDVYTLAATPEDVRTVARLILEAGAFHTVPPDGGTAPADALRTELEVSLAGKAAKRVYRGREPAELPKLRPAIEALFAAVRARGQHQVKP
jgi:hypothetical protein